MRPHLLHELRLSAAAPPADKLQYLTSSCCYLHTPVRRTWHLSDTCIAAVRPQWENFWFKVDKVIKLLSFTVGFSSSLHVSLPVPPAPSVGTSCLSSLSWSAVSHWRFWSPATTNWFVFRRKWDSWDSSPNWSVQRVSSIINNESVSQVVLVNHY